MPLAHVQAVVAQGTSASSVTTGNITTTTGSLIVVGIVNAATNTFAATPVTDSKGNSYTQAWANDANEDARQYYKADAVGGASHNFTCTLTAAGFPSICAQEISGAATTSPVDGTPVTATTTAQTTHTTGTLTTTQADTILVLNATHAGSTTALGPGTNFLLAGEDEDASDMPIIQVYRIVSAAAGYTGSWTSAAGVDGTFGMAAYKQAPPGGPGANAPTQRSRSRFNLQQMADAEDEGRFNELDVRNWWFEAFA